MAKISLESRIEVLEKVIENTHMFGADEGTKQIVEWLKELKARRRIDKLDNIIKKTAQYQMPQDLEEMRNEIKMLEDYVRECMED